MSNKVGSINQELDVYIAQKEDMKAILRLLKGVTTWLKKSRLKQWEFLDQDEEDGSKTVC